MIRVYPVIPVSAPRQVRKDIYDPSPHVKRYRAYQDEMRTRGAMIPQPFHHAIFVLPMPPSWSAKKRASMEGHPHQQKPDRDNLEKALLDSVFGEDEHVWDGRTTKLWGTMGMVIVSAQPIAITLPFDLTGYYAAAMRPDAHAKQYQYAPAVPV